MRKAILKFFSFYFKLHIIADVVVLIMIISVMVYFNRTQFFECISKAEVENLSNKFLTIVSSLFGFVLTSFTILISLNTSSISSRKLKLLLKSEKNNNVINDNFLSSLIVLLASLFTIVLFDFLNYSIDREYWIIFVFIVLSLLATLRILTILYMILSLNISKD